LSPIPSKFSAISTPQNKHPDHPELPVEEIHKWNTPLISSVAKKNYPLKLRSSQVSSDNPEYYVIRHIWSCGRQIIGMLLYVPVVCKGKQCHTVGTEIEQCSSCGKTWDSIHHTLQGNTYLLQLGTAV
jgi:hypothetical protein